MNLPSKFKFFAFSSGLSGFILFIYGVSTLPQPNTSYYSDDSANSINSNSGQSRESFNQQNQQIIVSSMAFREMLAGLGICLLTVIAVVIYHRREARIEAITLEKEEQKKAQAIPSTVKNTVAPSPQPVPLKPILKSTSLSLETPKQPLPTPLVVTREQVPKGTTVPVSYNPYKTPRGSPYPRPSIEYIQYKRT